MTPLRKILTRVEREPKPTGHGTLVQSLTQRAKFFLFSYSPKLRSLISWSDNAAEILGVRDADIIRDGNLFLRHVHPDDRFLLLSDLERALRGEEAYRATYRWIRPDNDQLLWLHCRATLVHENGDPHFEGVILDLSSELTGPISTLAGPDSLSTVLAAFPEVVFTLDADLRLLRINRDHSKHSFNFGDPQFHTDKFRIGREFTSCFEDSALREHYLQVLRQILTGSLDHFTTRVSEGTAVYRLEVTPLTEYHLTNGLLITVSDISKIVELESKIAALRKNEGLQRLASGVAHHFNNALQGIVGHAAAIHHHPHNPALVADSSATILDIVNRTSELVRQLLVVDDENTTRVPVDVNLALMAAINSIGEFFEGGVKLSVAFSVQELVLAQQERLIQAFTAILKNACEAIGGNGTLALKTIEVTLRELEVEDLPAGSYAKIAITDSGRGMTRSEIDRCLEPFFTTKGTSPARGIRNKGLGLSSAFGTVREFGGSISVESLANVSTTIAIYLPLYPKDPRKRSLPTLLDRSHAEVLVVDDDRMILETVSLLLNESGFTCITAENGTKAIELVSEIRSLKLILLDAEMADTTGAKLLHSLKAIRGDLKVLGFTGGAQSKHQELLDAGASAVIAKPIDPRRLRELVAESVGPS